MNQLYPMNNGGAGVFANQAASLTQSSNYETTQYLAFNRGAKATGKPSWQLFGAYLNGYESRFAGYGGAGSSTTATATSRT